jgi:hypothetical protein
MIVNNVLVDASSTTLQWLEKLERGIKREIDSDFKILRRKYWAPLRKQGDKKHFAYIHPQKNQIRIVIRLPKSASKYLVISPATKNWYNYFPGMFKIKNEDDINIAIRILKAIYILTYDELNEELNSTLIQNTIINVSIIEANSKVLIEMLSNIYKKLEVLEESLKYIMQSDFEKIADLWRKLKNGEIDTKEFLIELGKSIVSKLFDLAFKK